MFVTSYHNNNHVIFYRIFWTATKQGRFVSVMCWFPKFCGKNRLEYPDLDKTTI